ncbi:DUF47 family protein [Shewanella sp. AS16]|uniref:DUF47 domain-containing protein n=1 Tax=Shewanella sp. AS16 TaxID=2907625 RepID=UPI001F22FB64|nr:DUF47 family protein [Shewanella sp. AS16]MCE9685136.1 DUF47 family protein [Shewanella sp. AS16]
MTNEERPSFLKQLVARIVPTTTDFFALLVEQCANAAQCTGSLVSYMETGDERYANQTKVLEHEGDRLKERNLESLHRAFSTPIDREDIFRAVTSIDAVLNYAKSTVSEMYLLGLPPDPHTLAMAQLLDEGTNALLSGFNALQKDPEKASQEAERARKTERKTENIYRTALTELFDAEHYLAHQTAAHRLDANTLEVLLEPLDPAEREAVASSVAFVVEIMKRREIYRHMSNAADRVALAGETLRDIVVKIT